MQKQTYSFFIFLFLMSNFIFAQNSTLSGYIYDQKTGESLVGVGIFDETSKTSTVTNEYGFYSLTLVAGKHNIVFSYLGYEKVRKEIDLNKNISQTIRMVESSNELATVEVTASAQKERERVSNTELGKIDIPMSMLKKAPVLLGESDIIKVLQLLPGIKRGGEGQVGMFVRGGGSDENLILLDEAPVYNAGHLLGFFSVFNSSSIKDVSMYKAAFPAIYGGRLSSILDIKMKEGNDQRIGAEGSLGLISSNLTVEGPILKNKASFIVSGRRTYIDKVFQLLKAPLPYYFYDLNMKVNYKISDRDRLYLSSYFGRDVLYAPKIKSDSGQTVDLGLDFTSFLGNFTVSSRWNHAYQGGKLFHNLTVLTSQFKYKVGQKSAYNSFSIESNINDIGVKLDYDYRPNSTTTVRFGANLTNHDFRPNIIYSKDALFDFQNPQKVKLIRNQELAFYGSAEHDFSEALKVTAGLRVSSSFVQGASYAGLEPRLAARYNLTKNTSLKVGYARMKQYLHLVGSSAIALPTDLWYPTTKNVKPGRSDQASIGIFHYLEKVRTNLSVEGYYKWMDDLIEYREGAVLLLNDNYEKELVVGKGRGYGFEFLAQRSRGQWTGWLGYTWSVSNRTFPDLNLGNTYYSKYDRRHDFSIVSMYDVTPRFSTSMSWVYSSGQPFTPTFSQFLMPNATLTKIDVFPIYTAKNAVRLSSAHRLDIDFCVKGKKKGRYQGEWHFSSYNTYSRVQPSRLVRVYNNKTQKYEYYQRGLFGFVGSISYNFKF
jgi:CarboxypepD_reg-like domain/TonB-dependent Receptor Plug Domain